MALVVMNVKFLARFKFSSLAFAALQKVHTIQRIEVFDEGLL